ncbi:MAG TPA: carboxypeptidase regulatory-like domain-containing protein [Gemmatimonadaceae bacterium]|nr:carboxypeptidase regulatory-like domain-containing protein [Gemmatimonadaceae bacterium]
MMWRRTFLVAGALLVPAIADAQTVRGTIVADADQSAVGGVVVLLVDSSGATVARSLSDAWGAFHLATALAGSYRLRTLRIGYRPVTSASFTLTAGSERTERLSLPALPVSLAAVNVRGRSTCTLDADSALGTYALWEQARMAFTATDLSSRAANMYVRLVTYDRVLDRSNRLRTEQAVVRSGPSSKPWVSRPANSLHQFGYVIQSRGAVEYSAPDLDVLLSPDFQEDHCFRAVATRDTSVIGLEFEPAPNRSRMPEIRGSIWLDRATAQLRRMDFVYTNTPHARGAPDAGGEIAFVRMKHGVWAIAQWNIRMPVMVPDEMVPVGPIERASMAPPLRLAETKVTGGELALAVQNDDTLLVAPLRTFSGVVVDAQTGAALSGADVVLQGTTTRAVTDASGRFSVAAIPGDYKVLLKRSASDSTEAPWPFSVSLASSADMIRLRAPPPRAVTRVATLPVAVDTPAVRDALHAPPSDSGRAIQHLQPVEVSDKAPVIPEFEERRRLGIGHFLARADLEKAEFRRLADVLGVLPGVRIFRAPGGQAWVISGRGADGAVTPDAFSRALGARPACYVDVWLDGMAMFIGSKTTGMLFDINTIPPSTLEGVEFYSSSGQTPIKFARYTNQCGVLVLWSRQGP